METTSLNFPWNDIDTTECEYGFGWKVVLMGYGCGMKIGMIMGCFVFLIGREPNRKVRRPNNRHRGRRN